MARAQFYPKLVPAYGQSADGRGASSSTSARSCPGPGRVPLRGGGVPLVDRRRGRALPRTSDARLVLTQPLLRGFGPNAALYDLRNSQPRARESRSARSS